jgi:hypothetical protein
MGCVNGAAPGAAHRLRASIWGAQPGPDVGCLKGTAPGENATLLKADFLVISSPRYFEKHDTWNKGGQGEPRWRRLITLHGGTDTTTFIWVRGLYKNEVVERVFPRET